MADRCGISCWHPQWMRRFENTRWFLITYGLLGTIQATAYTYFVVTLSTIEKRFKIPSQTTGIILSGNEISQILLSLTLTYYGGQSNRPRWIAWGVVFAGLSCFILALPHFIYGAGDDAIQLTKEYLSDHQFQNLSSLFSEEVPKKSSKLCKSFISTPDECVEVFSYLPLILIFLSQFVLGIGNTLYHTLGQTYLDDNTHHRKTPLMLAYAFSLRMFGPILGYGLSYVIMLIYIDPTLTPVILKEDSRWLGAYWLGWLILGFLMFVFAAFIGMFPRDLQIQKKKIDTMVEEFECKTEPIIVIDDSNAFLKALMRLIKNKLLMFNNIATIFYILSHIGLTTYMSRVMEVQFNRSSAGGSIFTGPVKMLGMLLGLLTSGIVISKYQPAPKYLFFWNVIVGIVSMVVILSYSHLGCQSENSLLSNGTIALLEPCNSNCFCAGISYTPVCDPMTSKTYFSPCHAGCKQFDKNRNSYADCVCSSFSLIDSESDVIDTTSEANKKRREGAVELSITPGACMANCDFAYYTFSLIVMCKSFIHSTGRIGNVLLNLRAVETRDKSLSQGLSLFLNSLFASIPGPIIFGYIIDNTCLIWSSMCGKQGNCQLYDPELFRYYLHTISAIFVILAVIFDTMVWHFGKNLKLYDDPNEKETKAESLPEIELLNK